MTSSSAGKLLRFAVFVAGVAAGASILFALGVGRIRQDISQDAAGERSLAEILRNREGAGDWDPALGAPPRFSDVTAATGVRVTHDNGHSGAFHYPEIMGAGAGVFDYDGDGLMDLYFINGNHLVRKPSPEIINRLYHNNGDWTFTDVTQAAGVGDPSFGQGCCTGDYDNDGDEDLYVSNYGVNVLYNNKGDGTFTDVARKAGVADPGWGQSSSFLDYNGDGWLDLYVQNYLTYDLKTEKVAFMSLGGRKIPDYASPSNYRGSPDRLYRNNGNGTFTDVTKECGIYKPDGKGMGCACFDFDGDGHTDIYVANDGMENYLFHNRGDGTFEEIGLAAGVAFDCSGIPEGSMGVDVGDYDGDGRLDMINPCLRRQSYTLYRNLGDHFLDASRPTQLGRLTAGVTGFNANFLDYDSDGDLDVFFTTGGVRANELLDVNASYRERYGLPDKLLANDGEGHFADVSRWAGPHFEQRLIGRGSAAADLDNDGDLDLVICNLRDKAVILKNETRGGHWITLVLRPRQGNRDALGSNVWIEAGGRRQHAAVNGGVTYLSQRDRRIHFGLAGAATIDRLTIRWPGGEEQTFEDIPADRFLTLEQGKKPER